MADEFRTATDAEMAQWLRMRTNTSPVMPSDEQLIAVRLAERLQTDLDAARAYITELEARSTELEKLLSVMREVINAWDSLRRAV